MFFLIGVPLIAIFLILWYMFGGLRTPFGKVLVVFSVIGLLLVGVLWTYILTNVH